MYCRKRAFCKEKPNIKKESPRSARKGTGGLEKTPPPVRLSSSGAQQEGGDEHWGRSSTKGISQVATRLLHEDGSKTWEQKDERKASNQDQNRGWGPALMRKKTTDKAISPLEKREGEGDEKKKHKVRMGNNWGGTYCFSLNGLHITTVLGLRSRKEEERRKECHSTKTKGDMW